LPERGKLILKTHKTGQAVRDTKELRPNTPLSKKYLGQLARERRTYFKTHKPGQAVRGTEELRPNTPLSKSTSGSLPEREGLISKLICPDKLSGVLKNSAPIRH